MNWFDKAGCKSLRTSIFFENFENADNASRAKIVAICAACPVRKECQEYAESRKDTYGLWAGFYYKNGTKKDALRLKRASVKQDFVPEYN
jgi:WhiB family redox-sensing transcriptional regulator